MAAGSCSIATGRWSTTAPPAACTSSAKRATSAGALAINIIAVGGLFTIVFVAALVVTVPEVPVAPILAILIPIVVLGPIVYYPFSKTVWVAVDRAFLQHLDSGEVRDEQHRR